MKKKYLMEPCSETTTGDSWLSSSEDSVCKKDKKIKTMMNPQTFKLIGHRLPKKYSVSPSHSMQEEESVQSRDQSTASSVPSYPHLCPPPTMHMNMPMPQTYHHGGRSLATAPPSAPFNPPAPQQSLSFSMPPMMGYRRSPLRRGLHKS